jgi:hypothetical protein
MTTATTHKTTEVMTLSIRDRRTITVRQNRIVVATLNPNRRQIHVARLIAVVPTSQRPIKWRNRVVTLGIVRDGCLFSHCPNRNQKRVCCRDP